MISWTKQLKGFINNFICISFILLLFKCIIYISSTFFEGINLIAIAKGIFHVSEFWRSILNWIKLEFWKSLTILILFNLLLISFFLWFLSFFFFLLLFQKVSKYHASVYLKFLFILFFNIKEFLILFCVFGLLNLFPLPHTVCLEVFVLKRRITLSLKHLQLLLYS